jgi:hypothetical protein
LSLLWNTGTNKANGIAATIGFLTAADDTSAISYVGDSEISCAYAHTIVRATGITLPSYTFFVDRGISKQSYPLCCIKTVKLSGSMDGKVKVDAEGMFKSEADGTAVTMTPTWTDPVPFMFYQTGISVGGSPNLDIKSWNVEIDNQSQAQRGFTSSQDIRNILAVGKLLVKGGFEIYFENETERTKFLGNTEQTLEITLTGAAIRGAVTHKLVITIPRMHYEAYPFGDIDSMLGAQVTFNAFYKAGGVQTQAVKAVFTNTVAAY